jgi:ketopantoate reductase
MQTATLGAGGLGGILAANLSPTSDDVHPGERSGAPNPINTVLHQLLVPGLAQ